MPECVPRSDLFDLARCDLERANRYIRILREHSAADGILQFTTIPVRLASRTLDRIEEHGPGAKVLRPEVIRIVSEALSESGSTTAQPSAAERTA